MPEPTEPTQTQTETIRSGPQVVQDFLTELQNDAAVDHSTLAAIRQLYQDEKLTHTNLLRKLEDARKVSEP
jgi:hypothetical protein